MNNTQASSLSLIKTIRNFFLLLLLLLLFLHQNHRALTPKTTELIVKCHTILEMGSQDLSLHTFRFGPQFWKGPQKGVKKNFVKTYFLPREGLIRSIKI